MQAGAPPLRSEEVRRVITALAPLTRKTDIVLIGGQALAFWSARFAEPSGEISVVASKDIDFEGSADAARTAATLLDAEVMIPSPVEPSPVTGVVTFTDADGNTKKLSDWRGRTVLVNLWATWCVPCRKEMPALDSLQGKLGGSDFQVVAVNIDTRDPEKPRNFLKDENLTRLSFFSDEKAKVFQDLKNVGRALGMPTSVLVDGQGCEIATIAGPAEWASDDAVKLISAAVKPASAGS